MRFTEARLEPIGDDSLTVSWFKDGKMVSQKKYYFLIFETKKLNPTDRSVISDITIFQLWLRCPHNKATHEIRRRHLHRRCDE